MRSRCSQLQVFTQQEKKEDSDGERFPKRLRLKTQPVLLLRCAPVFFLPLWLCKLASVALPRWISPNMGVKRMFKMALWLEKRCLWVFAVHASDRRNFLFRSSSPRSRRSIRVVSLPPLSTWTSTRYTSMFLLAAVGELMRNHAG